MPFCPECHSEYREGIARCAHCQVELVAAMPERGEDKSQRLRAAVEAQEAAALARASYTEACQMVEALHSAGVDAMVTGDVESCGKNCQPTHFFVAVLEEDVPAAARVLRSEWRKLISMDADCAGANPDVVVDLDTEGQHACPACGSAFEGTPEECPECGLFLGVG
jgi:hypothetical protein